MTAPLDGITVVAPEQAVAVPFATRRPALGPVPALGQHTDTVRDGHG